MENSSSGNAALIVEDKKYELPILVDREGQCFLDIRQLAKSTEITAYDPGFANTASCASAVSLVNGTEGKLLYRGYPVEVLAENCVFVEVAYLLIHGKLPNAEERQRFSDLLNRHSMIHEDMRAFFHGYPEHSHPMAILSAMVVSLSSFYPEIEEENRSEELDITATRLLSKLRTIAAFSYKKSVGEPIVYPRRDLDYCSNFLNMMFSSPVSDYEVDPVIVAALNKLLILHADHGQNCSTSTVRLVGSSGVNLYASISAGICALWGQLHGGANQEVIEMLEQIQRDGGSVDRVIERAQDKNDPFRLMGFGHRVYKTYDPRARIAKQTCKEVLAHLGVSDPLLDLALVLEEKALAHPFFQERKLFPNIDFYTGITYRAMGIP
ncbi:MAG TPA: citrate synthase, partial [Oligoflexia bacterium]|nr:citrate synthase [Oligoflexia bacterium]